MDQFIEKIGRITDYQASASIDASMLLKKIQDKAQLFRNAGIRRQDRLALLQENSSEFFVDLLAAWKIGACVLPLDHKLPFAVLRRLLHDAGINAVAFRNPPQHLDTDCTWISSLEGKVVSLTRRPKEARPAENQEALILYTSGTSSGSPKGVVHGFAGIHAKMDALSRQIPRADLQNSLCILPTHFGHGLIANCLFPLLNGAHLVLCPPLSPEVLLQLGEIIDRYEITFMSSVPAVWKYARSFQGTPPAKNTLKRVCCASEPLANNLRAEVMGWLGCKTVNNIYGITECASWVAGPEPGRPQEPEGFIGRPWGASFAIRDESENPLPANEVGILHVRSPALMLGYWREGRLDRDAVSDGWFNTGDHACIDQNGNLILKGRKQNVINSSGIKVYPEELETFLATAPGVAEAAVFPIEHAISGQAIGAAVVFEKSVQARNFPPLELWCRDRIPSYQVPHAWIELPALPRTSRGKIDRLKLIEKYGK